MQYSDYAAKVAASEARAEAAYASMHVSCEDYDLEEMEEFASPEEVMIQLEEARSSLEAHFGEPVASIEDAIERVLSVAAPAETSATTCPFEAALSILNNKGSI
jgi:sugar phosphate isomerase/epimerase